MSKVFKSLWFKCIVVLLVIAIISGGLLAILNSVFAVSDEERTKRAVKKIYGEEKTNKRQSESARLTEMLFPDISE